jgi:hypothetical protein
MIVVLLTPLILTSIFMVGGIMKEGAQNMKDEDKTTEVKPSHMEPVKKNVDSNNVKPLASKDKKKPDVKNEEVISETEDQVGNDEHPVGDVPDKADSGMTTMYKKRNRIDYASTVEDAYGDLNKILGGDGIKRLTDDTQKLMGQQMQLAEAMKSMTPLLSQAKSLMAGFDTKQFGDITAMAKQFGVAK